MPTPTATIFLPYHALDDVILRGTRAAQPLASAVVAGTLYGVTDEGNLVERSTGAVWQAYSPTGGAPAAHHATHEPGGSDALAALSAAVLTSGTLPDARLSANVARRDQANTFVAQQTIDSPTAIAAALFIRAPSASAGWRDTAGVAGQQTFRQYVQNGRWLLDHTDDPMSAVVSTPLIADATGDVSVQRNLYEKGRAAPLGHWVDVPYSAANYVADAGGTWTVGVGTVGAHAYTLIGLTMLLTVVLTGTTVTGAPGSLQVLLPPGFTVARATRAAYNLYDPATGAGVGYAVADAGTTRVLCYRNILGAAWSAGTAHLQMTLVINVA